MSRSMYKFMILFDKPKLTHQFETTYNEFLALVVMPGIQRRQVINIHGSPTGETRLYRILEVYFEDQSAMEAALRSEAGQEAGGELARFKADSFELVFAEVFEEEGGQTPILEEPADSIVAAAESGEAAAESSDEPAEESAANSAEDHTEE